MRRATARPQRGSTLRRTGRAAAAAASALLACAAVARAAVIVDVVSSGVPVPGETVALRDSAGDLGSAMTNAAGRAVLTPSRSPVGAMRAVVAISDSCRFGTSEGSLRTASADPVADGAGVVLTADARAMCAASFTPAGLAEPTGAVDASGRRVLALPGGTVDLHLLLPSTASDVVVSARGVPLNAPAIGDQVRVQAPAGGYEGPLTLSYSYDGQKGSYPLGTMTSRPVVAPARAPGPVDIEAIVDISGSMAGTDPQFLRKDAMSLLTGLARPGDRLGAVGFDDAYQPIFPLTTMTGSRVLTERLRAAAGRAIIDRGGTDYNVGLGQAYAALTATPGVDPARQKGVIFLTDGGHNAGAYANGHLFFALNGSGRPWPVCVVQLGRPDGFKARDVARLRRIAAETAGRYFATDRASDLTDIYNRCFTLSTGQRTLADRTFAVTAGGQRGYRQTLPRGLPQATFFANWGNGAYDLVLTDPRGKLHSARRPGAGVTFRRGATFAFFRVTRPPAGRWTVQLRNLSLTAPADRARSTITTPRG